MIALDTNILLRLTDPTSGQNQTAQDALAKIQAAGEVLCIFPQNVYEFWSAAARPQSANGLGFSIPECLSEVNRFRQFLLLLDDLPGLFDEWFALVQRYQCHGKVSYDARIVAAMNTHGLARLLTFNAADFARYPGLTALDPAAV